MAKTLKTPGQVTRREMHNTMVDQADAEAKAAKGAKKPKDVTFTVVSGPSDPVVGVVNGFGTFRIPFGEKVTHPKPIYDALCNADCVVEVAK